MHSQDAGHWAASQPFVAIKRGRVAAMSVDGGAQARATRFFRRLLREKATAAPAPRLRLGSSLAGYWAERRKANRRARSES